MEFALVLGALLLVSLLKASRDDGSPTSDAAASALISTTASAMAPELQLPPRNSGAEPLPSENAAEPLALRNQAEPVANYTLHARLDDVEHRIYGSGNIVLFNRSSKPVSELYLHLYLNAFKNNRTLFNRSPTTSGRSGDKPLNWGYTEVEHLRVEGKDLWPSRELVDPEDETDVRVPLPSALQPGARLDLELSWVSQLPEIVERTGYSKDFHLIAQWFPKLAKLEADGSWAHFPFHPQAEFYADFGDYDVTLDTAERFVLGASGEAVETHRSEGRQRVRYQARNVHDFAFSAWPDFLTHEEQIDGVRVRVLYPPGHALNRQRTLAALRFGLPHYGERYGRYPYPTLTVVHPPQHASNAGGMEYPTLITTGGAWYAPYFSRAVEMVTLHELAHQWFYGLLASNEARFPFLDEGLASYAELVAARDWFGQAGAMDLFGLQVSVTALHRALAARSQAQAVAIPAREFASFVELGSLVYSRTAVLLATVGAVYGADALQRGLLHYSTVQRFKHPEPSDLLDALATEFEPGVAEQVKRALFEKGWVDYQVSSLASVRETALTGFVGSGFPIPEFAPEADLQAPYRHEVLVLRHGTLQFPVELTLRYEDGSSSQHSWDGQGDVLRLTHASSSLLVSAEVDPTARVLLDQDLLNNVYSLNTGSTGRVVERALYIAQVLQRYVGP